MKRALAWIRRVYSRLPMRLRAVGPYQEALARLQGGQRPDLAVRSLNRLWIRPADDGMMLALVPGGAKRNRGGVRGAPDCAAYSSGLLATLSRGRRITPSANPPRPRPIGRNGSGRRSPGKSWTTHCRCGSGCTAWPWSARAAWAAAVPLGLVAPAWPVAPICWAPPLCRGQRFLMAWRQTSASRRASRAQPLVFPLRSRLLLDDRGLGVRDGRVRSTMAACRSRLPTSPRPLRACPRHRGFSSGGAGFCSTTAGLSSAAAGFSSRRRLFLRDYRFLLRAPASVRRWRPCRRRPAVSSSVAVAGFSAADTEACAAAGSGLSVAEFARALARASPSTRHSTGHGALGARSI